MSDQHISDKPLYHFSLSFILGEKWTLIVPLLMILTLISLISPATSLTEKSQHKVTVHDSVHRINYGIIFRSAGMVQLSQEHWIQTFQIPIPQPIHVGDLSFCNNTSPLCVLSNSILAQIHGSQLTTAAHINKTLDFIRSLIPYHKITASRARRSLLLFIGGR